MGLRDIVSRCARMEGAPNRSANPRTAIEQWRATLVNCGGFAKIIDGDLVQIIGSPGTDRHLALQMQGNDARSPKFGGKNVQYHRSKSRIFGTDAFQVFPTAAPRKIPRAEPVSFSAQPVRRA